jgi:two-component system, NtrC family, response regulator AtoC
MTARILVVDDEKLIRWSLRERLSADGHEVVLAADLQTARQALNEHDFDLTLLDLRLPDGNGIDLLKEMQSSHKDIPVVIITAYSTVDSAVAAMKEGAYDYISKPFNMDDLTLTVRRALEIRSLRHTLGMELDQKKKRFGIASIIGESKPIQRVKEIVCKVAASDTTTVLLLGETGCGKDMIARAIHYESARVEMPFMNITCIAMPEPLIESELFGYEAGVFTDARGRKQGLFELGHRGTVFLDEIGDIASNLQAKLLRVLDDKVFRRIGGMTDIRVDCRVIAATNRDLGRLMEEGKFREDLYFRLSALPISVPSLRERVEDVPLLARHYLDLYRMKMGRSIQDFTPEAIDHLRAYPWPGNVRELRNVVERAVLLCSGQVIGIDDIVLGRSDSISQVRSPKEFILPEEGCCLDDVEKTLLIQALERTQGNQTRTADLLGVSRDQIRYKITKYGLTIK